VLIAWGVAPPRGESFLEEAAVGAIGVPTQMSSLTG